MRPTALVVLTVCSLLAFSSAQRFFAFDRPDETTADRWLKQMRAYNDCGMEGEQPAEEGVRKTLFLELLRRAYQSQREGKYFTIIDCDNVDCYLAKRVGYPGRPVAADWTHVRDAIARRHPQWFVGLHVGHFIMDWRKDDV